MLDWTPITKESRIIYQTTVAGTAEQEIRTALENCAKKSIDLLVTNIQDDSLYLLFEWTNAKLNLVVTDATKEKDAPIQVQCDFIGLASAQVHAKETVIDENTIKFWLHDYLASCSEFFNYSLVAIFHSSTRKATTLL